MNKNEPCRKRIIFLDYIRAVAIFSVTVNHALNRSFSTDEGTFLEFQALPSWMTMLKAFLYMFSRLGVPLFLMITGALLLDRNYNDKNILERFLRHNWGRLFITAEIWLIIRYWYLSFASSSTLRTKGLSYALLESISSIFFINQKAMGSMWYMPMILCIYLMIPIISEAIRSLGDRYVKKVAFIVALGGMVIPSMNGFLKVLGYDASLSFALAPSYLFSRYLLYVLCGHWVFHGVIRKWSNSQVVLFLLLAGGVMTAYQYFAYSSEADYALGYSDIGILLTACLLFELMMRYCKKDNAWIRYIARIAFGIYFVHICIMEGLNAVITDYYPVYYLTKFFVLEGISLLGAIALIIVTMRIKFFKEYLYMIKD